LRRPEDSRQSSSPKRPERRNSTLHLRDPETARCLLRRASRTSPARYIGKKIQRDGHRYRLCLGVSASSVSRHFIEASSKKLKEFKERDLSSLAVFAVFIDTVHRGKDAFMVALGIDIKGHKHVLGFWQGTTESHEICEELLADIERRGLFLSNKTLFVTDGGKGVIKALRGKVRDKAPPPTLYHP